MAVTSTITPTPHSYNITITLEYIDMAAIYQYIVL